MSKIHKPDFPTAAKATPEKIEVPDAEYQAIYETMVNAFLGQRVGCETLDDTRGYVKTVLDEAVHGMRFKNGKWEVWSRCPAKSAEDIRKLGWREALRKRLRIYHYDLEDGFQGNPHQKDGEEKEVFDPANPYGLKLSPEDRQEMQGFIDQLMEEFPQLDTVSDYAGVEMLAFLRLKTRDAIRSNTALSDRFTRMYKELTDTLGISGQKRLALQGQASEGTLEELVKIYEQTKAAFPEIEEEEIREEFALLRQKRDAGSISDATMWAWIKRYGYEFRDEGELDGFIGGRDTPPAPASTRSTRGKGEEDDGVL